MPRSSGSRGPSSHITRRRTDGSSARSFDGSRARLSAPTSTTKSRSRSAFEMYIGTPEAVHDRVATLVPDPAYDSDEFYEHLGPDAPGGQTAFIGRERRFGQAVEHAYNDPRMWRAESPAGNGIMDARSLARLYAVLANGGEVDGVRLLSSDSIATWSRIRVDQNDCTTAAGFGSLSDTSAPPHWYRMGPGPTDVRRPGMGGAVGYADPDLQSELRVHPEPDGLQPWTDRSASQRSQRGDLRMSLGRFWNWSAPTRRLGRPDSSFM